MFKNLAATDLVSARSPTSRRLLCNLAGTDRRHCCDLCDRRKLSVAERSQSGCSVCLTVALHIHSWYNYIQFSPKYQDSAMKPFSNYAILLPIYMHNSYGFPFVRAKLHFRFHKFSSFWHASLLNKLCQIFQRYLTKCVLSFLDTYRLLDSQ